MDQERVERLRKLSTPHLADACVRLGIPVRCAPPSIRPIAPSMRCAGRVLPARHVGSADIFLEALMPAQGGDLLVVDNQNRDDEACIGDLVALEVARAGLSGIVIWGLHRDTSELLEIGLPIFSTGALPAGPRRSDPLPADALTAASIGPWTVSGADFVACDADGVFFISEDRLSDVITIGEKIGAAERRQADQVRDGVTFRDQVSFAQYLARRVDNPGLSFREHLRSVGGALEE